MVVPESVRAGEKIDALALELVGVEHVPIGFVGVAHIYEGHAAEPRPREPFVKFGKPGLLVERVSELVETPRVQIACGGAKALH